MIKRVSISLAFLFLVSPVIHAQNNYNEISLPQLMKKVQQGGKDFIILDVRTKGEYADTLTNNLHLNIGRIKSAINIPLQDLQQKPEAIEQLNAYKDKDIYVICSHSYRSRTISNLLMQKGFTKIINTRGGMSEWYRNYDELMPYAASLYENKVPYKNLSPSELFKKLKANEPVEFIGFSNTPRFFFDSLIVKLYQYFPDFKNVTYFKARDSAQVLEKAKAAKGKTIVLYNTVGIGAAENAGWLASNGITNVNYLIGNLAGFYEYLLNYQESSDVSKYLAAKSKIQFFTPLSFCKTRLPFLQWVDLRHDTLFSKITNGTKLSYKTIDGAVNFPYYKTVNDFIRQFPDKTKLYLFIPHQGYVGLELADALVKQGYSIDWLMGGIERWEWYTNNIDLFTCKDYLIK